MNHYKVQGPAIISFSGGRTSAYMLKKIIEAHDGTLPDDVIPVFANTGKERPETLDFVRDCAEHWGVHVQWVEYRQGKRNFAPVTYETASRNGEPFEELIRRRKYLPNPVTRFCTIELKIRAIKHFCMFKGWKRWHNVVGLRYDEGGRVMRAIAGNEVNKERWQTLMPLSRMKVTKRDVNEFWSKQNFDLRLKGYEGNCDLCFMKGRNTLATIMRENPGIEDWWVRLERDKIATKASGQSFRKEFSYAEVAAGARDQGWLFEVEDAEYDAECGMSCGGDG